MIDEKKLIEEMDKLFVIINGKVSDCLAEGFYRIEELIKEQPKVGEWIPADEPPKTDTYILLSFDNFSIADIGRYEVDQDGNGAYYPGDDDKSYSSYGLFVNAWQPLPEPYKEEVNQ
jgi:hypothetical protein